jgi:hypothetical protein
MPPLEKGTSMSVTHVVGIDPGLVHTGCVLMTFAPEYRTIVTSHEAIAGPDTAAVNDFITQPMPHAVTWGGGLPHVFIEDYRPRSNLATDKRMLEAVREMRKATGGLVLNNAGVKKVVKRPLLELLGMWRFTTVTHHQDLRSAARIAVLGMLKDPFMNQLLADVVLAHVEGKPWSIQ